MNIFILNEDPTKAAQDMCNKHVVKMPTESLQMMSTIADHLGYDSPYKPVMLNHPCTIWARKSKQNFVFLKTHCEALCKEYSIRYYDRIHKVETTLKEFHNIWEQVIDTLPDIGLTAFAVAISEDSLCRKVENFDELSTVEKYRTYYVKDKIYFAKWKSEIPRWFSLMKGMKGVRM